MSELVDIGTRGAAWVATYAVHSTVLLGLVLLCVRLRPHLPAALGDVLWKGAAVAGLFTATLASFAGVRPLLGEAEVPAAVRAVHVVRELRTAIAGEDGGEWRRREVRRLDPGFQVAHAVALGFAAFLLAAACRTASFTMRRRRFRHRLRDRAPLADEPGCGALVEWLRTLPELRGVEVTVSDVIAGPAAITRREICLPRRMLRELHVAEQHAILAHEAAHLARRDPLWLDILGALHAALFFQPLQRAALNGFQRSAELLCDDWAVAATGRPIALARSLVRVATWVRAAPPAPVPALAVHGVSCSSRVERLLQARADARDARSTTLVLAAAMIAVLALPVTAPRVAATSRTPTLAESDMRVLRVIRIDHDSMVDRAHRLP